MILIYIHGFGSSGLSKKALCFKNSSISSQIICPSLPYNPQLAIENLKDIVELCIDSGDKISLIGSSLGGYYAMYLSHIFNIKAVLINPAIVPYKTLDKYIGMAQSYYDATQFEWTQEHIDDLMKFQVDNIDQNNILLLLQKGDEVLNYQDSINKFPFSQSCIEDGGSHSFDGIERYFDKIDEFIKQEYL